MKITKTVMCIDGVQQRPCTNAKFMHVAGLTGMTVKTHYDGHYHEETTSVYLNGELMAERVQGCLHFPGDKVNCDCWLVGYHKDIEKGL